MRITNIGLSKNVCHGENALAYFGAALVAKKLSNTDNRTKKLGWLFNERKKQFYVCYYKIIYSCKLRVIS